VGSWIRIWGRSGRSLWQGRRLPGPAALSVDFTGLDHRDNRMDSIFPRGGDTIRNPETGVVTSQPRLGDHGVE
jgi:hypothetical protein